MFRKRLLVNKEYCIENDVYHKDDVYTVEMLYHFR